MKQPQPHDDESVASEPLDDGYGDLSSADYRDINDGHNREY